MSASGMGLAMIGKEILQGAGLHAEETLKISNKTGFTSHHRERELGSRHVKEEGLGAVHRKRIKMWGQCRPENRGKAGRLHSLGALPTSPGRKKEAERTGKKKKSWKRTWIGSSLRREI